MLKQVRHISEGNFYGLRVTNKGRKLTLDKEIRNLKACKDVQSHVYRKEEKELINTLKRLQRSKHDPFSHYEYHDPLDSLRHPSTTASSLHGDHTEDIPKNLRRHIGGRDGSEQRSSTHGPSQVKVDSNGSDVSVIISLSPIASSTIASKQDDAVNLPLVKETGADIHRTEAFMSCVICSLPRYAQGRKGSYVCTCPGELPKHVLPGHEHHVHGATPKGRRKSQTNEEDVMGIAAKRERRRSLEIEDLIHGQHGSEYGHEHHAPHASKHAHANHPGNLIHAPHAPKHGHHETHSGHHKHYSTGGRSKTADFEEGNQDKRVSKGASGRRGSYDDGSTMVHGVGAHRGCGDGKRSRGNSFEEGRSRGHTFEGGRSRLGSLTEGHRSRGNSYGEHDDAHFTRLLKGQHGSRHNRTGRKGTQEEELHDLYLRLQGMFRGHDRRSSEHHPNDNDGERFHKYAHLPGDLPHATHLSTSKSRKGMAGNDEPKDQAPAFHGLVHPDNIINHHHFLPYEATKQDKRRGSSHQSQQKMAIHVHGVDRQGNRQDIMVTPGSSSSHIAAAFDRTHEQDSGTHSMLSKLRQLLNFYHRMDDDAPRYPWPSPPTMKFTLEEFQKLRNCRYLRLTKSNIESLAQLENRAWERQ